MNSSKSHEPASFSHSALHGAPAQPAGKIPALHRVPASLARRFQQVCSGVLAEVTQPEGLTAIQYAALASLDENSGLAQRQLANDLGIDVVSTGQLVDRLEAMRLVRREDHPTDRRTHSLVLTAEGEKRRRQMRPKMQAAQKRILAPLTPEEQATLIDLLTRVIEGNESYARPGNGRQKPRRSGNMSPTTGGGK